MNIKNIVFLCILALVPGAVVSQDLDGMMEQYKQMGGGTSKNFPREMEQLMPKGFTLKVKNFVWKETANMFMFMALSGKRKNDAYPKFGFEGDIEIGIMGYNPVSGAHVAPQMPVMMQQAKKGYAAGTQISGMECGKVAVSKINGADVYIQKCVRKNVEIDDHKSEDQTYYFANAIVLKKNILLQVRIIHYPKNEAGVREAIGSITGVFNATDFSKYMK